jgi:hypothetical protein
MLHAFLPLLHALLPVILVLGLVVIVIAVIKVKAGSFGQSADHDDPANVKYEDIYEVRPLLSAAELNFYRVLVTAVQDRFVIMSKVRLIDVFEVRKGIPKYQTWANKVMKKHVDFLLCHPQTMVPQVLIELDDKSHQRKDRQARDEIVDRVAAAVKLLILHVEAKRGYSMQELREMVGVGKMTAA